MGEKKISIKNLYLVSVICFGLVCLSVGSTYAIFTTQAEITNPIALSSNLSYDSSLMETISLTIGAKETITNTFNINNTSEENLNYIIYYIDEDLNVDFGTAVGNPTGTVATGASASVDVEIRNNTSSSVTIIMGILSGSGSVVLGSSMTAVPGEGIPPLLVEYISNLYINNKDATPVTNNNIAYTYASSVSLMNDRLGNSEVESDNGNIRYYGANPLNYIDIGDVYTEDVTIDNFEKNKVYLSNLLGIIDRDACYEEFDETLEEDMCGTVEKKAGDPKLYRIIGLFKDIEKEDGTTEDLVKIIREDSIGEFAWDLVSDDSGYAYGYDWNNSTLKSILNNEYFNSGSITHDYYDISEIWDYVNVTTDLSKKGLNSSVHDKIESVKWNLGGWNTTGIYADQIYGYERGEVKCTDCTYETIWPGKIALMYPSDYGYAVDFNQCGNTLYNYNAKNCFNNDWLYGASNGAGIEWLLTPSSDSPDAAWSVIGGNVTYLNVDCGLGVRPVLYLNSELVIETGEGSETNPYVVR